MLNTGTALDATGERLLDSYKNRTAVEHLHRYAIAKDYVAGKTVLDIASGEGYGSNLLAGSAKYVYGVDIAGEAVSHANAKYKRDNLEFLEGSAAKIPLADNQVDVIVSFETIEHHSQHEEMMKECTRVLKDHGVLVISSPDKKYYSDIPGYHNEYHVKELYKKEFFDLLKAHFQYVNLYKQGIVMGSIIYNDDGASQSPLQIYTGDYSGISAPADIENPNYNLIIAGNHPIPPHRNSFFESAFVNAELEAELEKYRSLYNNTLRSGTYQVAKMLGFPARVIRKMFN